MRLLNNRVWQQVNLSDVSLETCPRYSLVVDEDVKKPTKQANKQIVKLHIVGGCVVVVVAAAVVVYCFCCVLFYLK